MGNVKLTISLLLLFLMVGVGNAWALWRNDIGFVPKIRASK